MSKKIKIIVALVVLFFAVYVAGRIYFGEMFYVIARIILCLIPLGYGAYKLIFWKRD